MKRTTTITIGDFASGTLSVSVVYKKPKTERLIVFDSRQDVVGQIVNENFPKQKVVLLANHTFF